jgi:hypothetical protein
MTSPVALVPLRCLRCETPIPAEPDEVAWTCAQCGQGCCFTKSRLVTINIHYSQRSCKWQRPAILVTITGHSRQVYGGGSGKMLEGGTILGNRPAVCHPAFTCPLDTLLSLATQFLNQPPALQDGPTARYAPVSLSPEDAPALAEYIVMAVEAGRRDNLKAAEVSVYLEPPDLWVLP